jgi:hypothetical protein
MLKSIAVVIGSYVLSIVLVICTDPLLTRLFPGDFVRGRIPSTTPLVASTAFFFVISILCAWICARFAPSSPGRHVLWFLIVGEVMGLVFCAVNWNNGWPHWYPISWLLLWPLGCWIGLLFAGRRGSESSAVVS